MKKKIVKVLVVQEKAIPLHSLSGSNAVASRIARWSLTTFHTDKQYNVSLVSFWNQRLKSKVRNENTNRQIIWHTYISGQYKQNSISYTFNGITDIIYNEEFDPGSGWTLATGLTHASRGVLKELASDERPAHGWVTRIQPALHIGIAFRKGD